MTILFTQIYTEADVNFPFSNDLLRFLDESVSNVTDPSTFYVNKFGNDFKIRIYINAQSNKLKNEIRGPRVYRKTKDIEYVIVLPYTVINKHSDHRQIALDFLFQGVIEILNQMEIDTHNLSEKVKTLIATILSNKLMFEDPASDGI